MSEVLFVQMLGRELWVKFFCANGVNQSLQVRLSLRGKTKIAEFKMAEFKMAEFKIASIIKWSQNDWVKFFCANCGEASVSEVFFVKMVGTNLDNYEWCLRGKTKMAESKMAKF